MNILVVGIGGNGQTYFMNYLQKKGFQTNNSNDKDGLKHISCPSKLPLLDKNCKIIYVFNTTFDAICSHYRRKWPKLQMRKINIKNNCDIIDVNKFFSLTESTFFDHFGCKAHFLRWYKYNFSNNIYFLNLGKINKYELSKFLKCNISVFNNLIFDDSKRNNYYNIKSKYPLSNIMYTNIDNYITTLSMYRNKNSVK